MLACVDVAYGDTSALAACVLFESWTSARASRTLTKVVAPIAPYEPGAFYKRELPCIEAVLADVVATLEAILIDGYVWLGRGRPGLGAHLFDTLGGRVPVVGLAKTSFHDNDVALPVLRGKSNTPLFVTAEGIDAALACDHVRSMAGPHRIPTIVGLADALSRGR